MRITLTIDDDVFSIAKDLATRQHKTVGEIISALARQALQAPVTEQIFRGCVPVLTKQGTPITMKLVNQLRDEIPEFSSSTGIPS